MEDKREYSKKINSIVLNIGTSALTDKETGYLKYEAIAKAAANLDKIKNLENINITLVTSGAVGAGLKKLEERGNKLERPLSASQKQLASSIGYGILMSQYQKEFDKSGLLISPISLNASDFNNPEKSENTKGFLNAALACKNVIPIVNRNDTFETKELSINNNTFSAKVAKLMGADMLIIIDDNPKSKKSMHKLGVDVVIIKGNDIENIDKVVKGEKIGKYFPAKNNGFELDENRKKSGMHFSKMLSEMYQKRFKEKHEKHEKLHKNKRSSLIDFFLK